MTFLAFAAGVVGWGLVAVVVHELAHAIAAVVLGRVPVHIDLFALHVEWALPESGATWRDRAIGIAPHTLAVCVGALGLSGVVGLSLPQWIGIAVLAIYGGTADFRITTVEAA